MPNGKKVMAWDDKKNEAKGIFPDDNLYVINDNEAGEAWQNLIYNERHFYKFR